MDGNATGAKSPKEGEENGSATPSGGVERHNLGFGEIVGKTCPFCPSISLIPYREMDMDIVPVEDRRR